MQRGPVPHIRAGCFTLKPKPMLSARVRQEFYGFVGVCGIWGGWGFRFRGLDYRASLRRVCYAQWTCLLSFFAAWCASIYIYISVCVTMRTYKCILRQVALNLKPTRLQLPGLELGLSGLPSSQGSKASGSGLHIGALFLNGLRA